MKKVPRGAWLCQICRGTDGDLPYRKRAATIEKKRGRIITTKIGLCAPPKMLPDMYSCDAKSHKATTLSVQSKYFKQYS